MNTISSMLLLGLVATSGAQAQEWTFKPEIYARGGTTYKSDFSRTAAINDAGGAGAFNFGPYGQESLISYPLTEATAHIAYGDEFKYHLGVDVSGNRRFDTKNETKTFVAERVNYLEFLVSEGISIWYGNRPYRSFPEFLTRSFLFDEKNILGGGVRFEKVGPLNIELAYGSFGDNFQNGTVDVQDHTNVFINKLEYPLENGAIKTNLEIQQTKRTASDDANEAGTHGYLAGVSYQRWGDTVLGGGLYNQLILQYSKGFINKHIMQSAFNTFDADNQASKYLLTWNGDWKSSQYALYWVGIYQQHQGKSDTIDSSDLVWTTLDGTIRPLYALTPNINLGVELSRRTVLKEGDALPTGYPWATNTGMSKWAGLVQYTLENKNWNYPNIGVMAGEVKKDKPTQFFSSEKAKKASHFVHFFYEVNIN